MHRYLALVESFDDAKENEKLLILYGVLVQASLFSEKGITMAALTGGLGASYNTVKKLLAQVETKELLRVSTHERKIKYYEIDLDRLDDILLSEK